MKTKTLRDELLSTIALDPISQPVLDDLAALERLVPTYASSDVEELLIFRQHSPSLLPLRSRGQSHTQQIRRLIGLIAREPGQVEEWIDVANALTILTNASNLALLLLPTQSEDDAWAKEQFGRSLIRHARQNGDGEDIALARRAVGELDRQPMHLTMPEGAEAIEAMIEAMARRVGALQPKLPAENEPGEPGVYRLEDAISLKVYVAAAPDLGGLLDSARQALTLVDETLARGQPGIIGTEIIEAGLILAYARFLRIALWPARSKTDVAVKIAARDLVRSRDDDPDRFGALWEIAFGQGETVAGQSTRFINVGEDD